MAKYTEIEAILNALFDSVAWKSENIKTFPGNFVGDTGNKYIRISILGNGKGVNISSLSGALMIDIFVDTGNGINAYMLIADTLDEYLVGKTLIGTNGNIQLMNSTVVPYGVDKDTPRLFRTLYSIPFNFIGT